MNIRRMIDTVCAVQGISNGELAARMGKKKQSISKMKNQESGHPQTMKLLSDATEFPIHELLKFAEEAES